MAPSNHDDPQAIEHIARNYESPSYVLPTDDAERERLNSQHHALVRACDGKLFLSPITLDEGDQVLESGAGTGLWMLELANTLSEKVEIYGVDLTSRLFPSTYPSNMHFNTHSITSLPAEWTSKYTFVHQRLLMAALTKEMWTSAIAEIFRVLKPGGWVELQEHKTDLPLAGPNTIKLQSIVSALWKQKNLPLDLKGTLSKILEDTQFVNIGCVEKFTPFGKSEFENGTNIANVMAGLKTPVLDGGGYGVVATEEEFDALISGIRKEWRETDGGVTYFVLYAQKPLVF